MLVKVNVFHILFLCHSYDTLVVKSISRDTMEVVHKVCQIWVAYRAFVIVKIRVCAHDLPIVNVATSDIMPNAKAGNSNLFGALVLVG